MGWKKLPNDSIDFAMFTVWISHAKITVDDKMRFEKT